MKHHKLVSRTPLTAQTEYEPGETAYESLMNFLVAFVGQVIAFSFAKGGGTL